MFNGFHRSFFGNYLCLDDAPEQPNVGQLAVEQEYRAAAGETEVIELAASYNASYRQALAVRCAEPRFDVPDPALLAPELRTPRWQAMCDWLDHERDLAVDVRERLLSLVAKLGFYDHVRNRLQADVEGPASNVELQFLWSWSRYRLWMDGECPDYDASEFAAIADRGVPAKRTADASYQMVAQAAKHRRDLDACEYWLDRHRRHLELIEDSCSPLQRGILWSRYHRVAAFVPQFKRDDAGMHAEMDLAEKIARDLPRATPDDEIAADEILYPVLQSRIQEYKWVEDFDSARSYAEQYLAMAPNDSRAHIHLAEIDIEREDFDAAESGLVLAVALAPPGDDVASYLLGECSRVKGDEKSAMFWYLNSLAIDPQGVAPLEGLAELELPLAPVAWARQYVETETEAGDQP